MSNKLAVAACALLMASLSMSGSQADAHELSGQLPLPATAIGPSIDPSKGYTTFQVADDVWVVTDGVYQAMFASTGSGVVLFDAPETLTGKLKSAIASVTSLPVTHLFYSHSHLDHIGAAHEFAGTQIIASRETAEKIQRYEDQRRLKPTKIFDRKFVKSLGSLKLDLYAADSGHEPGNTYIYLPGKRILMAVDVVYPGWVPFTNMGMAQDVGRLTGDYKSLLSYDFDVFVGGHLGRTGNRQDVVLAQEYLNDLIRYAGEARRTTDPMAIVQRTGLDNKWLFAKAYMDAIAERCSEKMLGKWGARLGGADVSTPGHCWIVQEYLGINGVPRSSK